jgi:hypothetical protein
VVGGNGANFVSPDAKVSASVGAVDNNKNSILRLYPTRPLAKKGITCPY